MGWTEEQYREYLESRDPKPEAPKPKRCKVASEAEIANKAPMLTIRVIGTPGPQGSKRFLGHAKSGRGILVESSKKVRPWREAVKYAALEVMAAEQRGGPIVGPVWVTMVFTLARPKSAKTGARPDKRPDLSKLVRSTEDALTEAGVWEDDARVISCHARKVFPCDGPDSMSVPGCIVRIDGAARRSS